MGIFIINGCWILSNAFSILIDMIMCFLVLHFVYVVYHMFWFAGIVPTLHLWNKSLNRGVWYFFYKDFIYFLRGKKKGGRKRGNETSMCVRTLIACLLYVPYPRMDPTTLVCVLTRNWTSNLFLCGTTSSQMNHIGQGWSFWCIARFSLLIFCWGF